MDEPLFPKHGGYRRLKSFQVARLVYDVTVRFCDRFVDKRSRTHDQMVQAARSGVQNIAEGSAASGASKKMEITLTKVARASLEELLLDYEDFLRHRHLQTWPRDDSRLQSLVDQRCQTADQVALWVRKVSTPSTLSTSSTVSTPPPPEAAANGAMVLIRVAAELLDRQLRSLGEDFKDHGGFSERLSRLRRHRRQAGGDWLR